MRSYGFPWTGFIRKQGSRLAVGGLTFKLPRGQREFRLRIVSFHTGEQKYQQQAERLAASCDRLGLPRHIAKLDLPGSWENRCNAKPSFLLAMLMTLRVPILWVDVDCEILSRSWPFNEREYDFAIFNWHAEKRLLHKGQSLYDTSLVKTSSGVVFANYTAPAMELLVRWVRACDGRKDVVDDQILDHVMANEPVPLRVSWLPAEANWMVGHWGNPPPNCIIRHDWKPRVEQNQ